MTTPSTPNCLSFSTDAVAYLQEHLGLQEVENPATGGEYLTLRSNDEPIGFFKIWLGAGSSVFRKMTYLRIGIDRIGLDMNLFWVLTSRESAVPHFTCHYGLSPGGQYNFHVDLLPKVDGVLHPEYLEIYFRPLSPSFHEAKRTTGRRTRPSEHQYLMSGWGLYDESATAPMMSDMQRIVLDYIQHYCRLDERRGRDEWLTQELLSRRHDLQLEQLFSRETDPDSYRIMDELLGEEVTDLINDVHVKDGLPA